MKNRILFTGMMFLFVTLSNAQEEKKGNDWWLDFGAGKSLSFLNNGMSGLHFGLNYVLNDEYYLGVSQQYNFHPSLGTSPNTVYFSSVPQIRCGIRSQTGKNFYLTPSIGISYQKVTYAGYSLDQENEANQVISFLSSPEDGLFYEKVKKSTLAIPVNMNIMYSTKWVGISANFYLIASTYAELGFNVCLNVGKIHN